MTTPLSPRKRTSSQTKQDALSLATEVLSTRVQTLSDVVQTNNEHIQELRREVHTKPDDAEVQFITHMSKVTLQKVRNRVAGTALIMAVFSGGLSWYINDQALQERNTVSYAGCWAANERTLKTALGFENVANLVPVEDRKNNPLYKSLTSTAASLRKDIRDCNALYPADNRN